MPLASRNLVQQLKPSLLSVFYTTTDTSRWRPTSSFPALDLTATTASDSMSGAVHEVASQGHEFENYSFLPDCLYRGMDGCLGNTTTPKNGTLLANGSISENHDAASLSSSAMAFVYFMYAITIFMTVVGNITVIVVFARGRRSRTDIRGFLVNLAVSDLVIGMVCLPFSSVLPQLGWIFPDVMCPIVMFAQHMSVTASIYINAAIGIDRFLAVRFPFKRLTTSHSRVATIIAVIWLASTGLASVQLVVGRAGDGADGQRECVEKWPDPEFEKHYSIILLVCTYLGPVALVSIMYTLVCRQLWSSNLPGAADALRDGRQLKAKRKVVKMLIVIVALLTVCWLPLHIFFLLLFFCRQQLVALMPGSKLLALYYFVHLLAMSNSFQNPIIYGFLNDNFRSDLSEMLILCCPFCARFDVIQKAASRQHSSVSRHCSFRRQQCERYPMPLRRASVPSAALPDSAGSQTERLLRTRRGQLQVIGADFAGSHDSSVMSFQIGLDHINCLALANGHKCDLNDNPTMALLNRVVMIKGTGDGSFAAGMRSLSSLCKENDVITEECTRNEEVIEMMSFVRP